MSVFAVLHSTAPTDPRAALALAFPDESIPVRAPFRIVVPGLDVTAITPGRPNFLVEALGFDPAVSMHFVLDKTALALARRRLAKGLRSFLDGAAGDVVVLYGDLPVAARRPGGAWVRRGYDDLVEPQGWQLVATVVIPRAEPGASPAQPGPDAMITADVLVTWSRRLCRATSHAADVARSLGLTGRLTQHGDYWDLTPPPKDTQILFVRATTVMEPGMEEVGYIDITLPEPVPRGALDARFGSGQQLPQVHPDRPYKVAYHVSVPGAPYTCEVIAAFTDQPTTSETLAHGVVLRRDRSTP